MLPWQARRGRNEETAISDGLPVNRCRQAALNKPTQRTKK
nr:MAG TPA: hypothetical protein [Caudoviricetes sp.]